MHLFRRNCDPDYYFELLVIEEREAQSIQPLIPAIWAVAHRLCRVVWKMLHEGVRFIDQGHEVGPREKKKRAPILARALRKLGYEVTITPINQLAPTAAVPQEMAELAQKRLRRKILQLELALEGKLEEHHRFLLKLQLDRLENAETDLAALEQRIQEKLQSYAAHPALLQEIPGVERTLATVIIAELGVDMSVFQSVSQLAAWAGVCPGNNESAGK